MARQSQCTNVARLRAVSVALKGVEIILDDFGKSLEFAEKEDFVYLDPPYQPLSKTANFTSYTSNSFNEKEQIRLMSIFRELDNVGCKVMLSNSDTQIIRELYKDYHIEVVLAKRAINCKAEGRGKIKELVIMNY